MAKNGTHMSGPLVVAGVEVISETGQLTGDIGATAGSIGSAELADNILHTATVNISAAEIVGTDAGDLGHTAGTVLVPAAATGFVNVFQSAVISYTYGVAAYTGGGDDLVVRQGTTAVSGAVAKANLLAATANKIVQVEALAAAGVLVTSASTINLFAGTAYTQPGTAAGTLKVHVTYRTVAV